MPDDVRSLGGMYKEEIERRFDEAWKEINRLNAIVCGNGRLGMREDFMNQIAILRREFAEEIEKEHSHSKRNMQQGDIDVRGEYHRIEQKVDKMDDRNSKKIDKLTWIAALGIGAVLTVQSLFATGILHAAK